MPVFDWTRSSLSTALPDGSHSLSYEKESVQTIDPLSGELTLPGWDLSYQTEELTDILEDYRSMTEETLMENLVYFLQKIIPV
ncbi:mannonate dehydratase, partial [Staphylococcus sp. SIMBA_130]